MSARLRIAACLLFLLNSSFSLAFAQADKNPGANGRDAAKAAVTSEDRGVTTYTLPPEKLPLAQALARTRYSLYVVRVLYGALILLGLLSWRVAPRLRDFAERTTARRWLQALLFVPPLFLLIDLLGLPLAALAHAVRRAYALSVQSWGSWFWDWTKAAGLNVAVAVFVVWVLYAFLRRSPQRWWLWFWTASVPLVICGVFLTPLVVDPLFYDYRPLAQTRPALVPEIEKVVRRGKLDIPRERMFEMNAGAKWTTPNAYVTGIGPSKRVVVWDTTLRAFSVPQTLAVFGHEMGHYALWHIPKGMALAAVLILLFLYLGSRALTAVLARWGPRWQIRDASDWASLPVLLLFAGIFQFAGAPFENAFSRHIEHEADVYGLEVIHGVVPDAGRADAEAQQILAEAYLEDPDPPRLAVWWLYSHPPARDRIEFARSYRPWEKGQPPPKFVK